MPGNLVSPFPLRKPAPLPPTGHADWRTNSILHQGRELFQDLGCFTRQSKIVPQQQWWVSHILNTNSLHACMNGCFMHSHTSHVCARPSMHALCSRKCIPHMHPASKAWLDRMTLHRGGWTATHNHQYRFARTGWILPLHNSSFGLLCIPNYHLEFTLSFLSFPSQQPSSLSLFNSSGIKLGRKKCIPWWCHLLSRMRRCSPHLIKRHLRRQTDLNLRAQSHCAKCAEFADWM